MTQIRDALLSLILGLFNLIMSVIDAIEGALRAGLTQVGVYGQLQSVVLVIAAVLLIIAAVQLFGRIFAALIVLLLILLMLHILVPQLSGQVGHHLAQ